MDFAYICIDLISFTQFLHYCSQPYVAKMADLIKSHGYWSDNVRNYNDEIPTGINVNRVHEMARGRTRTY